MKLLLPCSESVFDANTDPDHFSIKAVDAEYTNLAVFEHLGLQSVRKMFANPHNHTEENHPDRNVAQSNNYNDQQLVFTVGAID